MSYGIQDALNEWTKAVRSITTPLGRMPLRRGEPQPAIPSLDTLAANTDLMPMILEKLRLPGEALKFSTFITQQIVNVVSSLDEDSDDDMAKLPALLDGLALCAFAAGALWERGESAASAAITARSRAARAAGTPSSADGPEPSERDRVNDGALEAFYAARRESLASVPPVLRGAEEHEMAEQDAVHAVVDYVLKRVAGQ